MVEGAPRWSPVDRQQNKPPMGERRIPPRLRPPEAPSTPPPQESRVAPSTEREGGVMWRKRAPDTRGDEKAARAQRVAEERASRAILLRTQIKELGARVDKALSEMGRLGESSELSNDAQAKEAVAVALASARDRLKQELSELET